MAMEMDLLPMTSPAFREAQLVGPGVSAGAPQQVISSVVHDMARVHFLETPKKLLSESSASIKSSRRVTILIDASSTSAAVVKSFVLVKTKFDQWAVQQLVCAECA